jgi:8-oxo-dGTP pyrophosphatase MutT (NUDIX family)
VRADNARAIALYRSLGFAWESTRRGFLRLADGRPVDDLVLVRTNRPVTCEKAAAALIRDRSICLFGHPSAGWQVPKGTLEPGEDAATAVLREVEEETRLVGARILAPLGSWHVLPPDGTVQRWHGFALAPPAGCPDRWDHVARGSVEEDGLVFELRWTPLAWADEVLPPQFHELVHRARALGGRGP